MIVLDQLHTVDLTDIWVSSMPASLPLALLDLALIMADMRVLLWRRTEQD